MMKLKYKIFATIVGLLPTIIMGQIGAYKYKQSIDGINQQWHKITLPNPIFSKISPALSDLRIYGFNENKDTLEIPYLIQIEKEKISQNQIDFKIINESKNRTGYFFTLKVPTKQSINQINLNFRNDNFDWRLKLEGSQNQNEWFTILDDYQILSIKNELTDFQFTTLKFQNANYKYYRIKVNSDHKPRLFSSNISIEDNIEGHYNTYIEKSFNSKIDKKNKLTIIDIELESILPVSYIKLNISDTFNYYRPITIKYLADSSQTKKGWIYNYRAISHSTLHSISDNEFKFNSTFLKTLRLEINNHDNIPLNYEGSTTKGYIHNLITRINDVTAEYFLVYGNKNARYPKYDIGQFKENIPSSLAVLQLGEISNLEKPTNVQSPLFENKYWMWGLLIIIILVLGFFSIKMLNSTSKME